MAVVATQVMPVNGAALAYSTASAGGDRFTPAPRTFLHVVNGNAAATNVTIATPNPVEGLALPGRVVAVPASTNRLIPLSSDIYRSADGLGDVTWSVSASVTFAVVQV